MVGDLLNIRCGDDLRDALARLVGGDFLVYADPMSEGPVPDLPPDEFREVRARFLNEAHGLDLDWARARLAAADRALATAGAYDRVVLWFEHDAYDQLILVRVLDRLGDLDNLALVSVDDFPGVDRFVGLGQLTVEQLATLVGREAPVTPVQVDVARRTWAALRQPDPTGLQAIADEPGLALPFLARALRRHLRELPAATDGLSLTERLCLGALAAGPGALPTVFPAVQREDPLPGQGDVHVASVLAGLSHGDSPLVTVADGVWSATREAAAVLAGVRRWVGPTRWVGGVEVTPDSPWVWDEAAGRVSRRDSSAR